MLEHNRMNTITLILLGFVLWLTYIMYNSYVGMQKELREIRLKCMGTPDSKYATDVPGKLKTNLIETLTSLAQMSA